MRVFLSSVMADYGDYRDAAVRAIESLDHEVIRAEDFGARPDTPQQAEIPFQEPRCSCAPWMDNACREPRATAVPSLCRSLPVNIRSSFSDERDSWGMSLMGNQSSTGLRVLSRWT